MYTNKIKVIFSLVLLLLFFASCKDLDELNINPNGVAPEIAHPNLLMSTIIAGTGQSVVGLGFGNIAGVMQHTQKDGWGSGHNSYDWTPSGSDWGGYYDLLRNTEAMLEKAEEMDLDFHRGVGLIIRAYIFGMIADLWGDAPYKDALLGEDGAEEHIRPPYDSQQEIYHGLLTDLDTANSLLSANPSSYAGIDPVQDVLYKGDVTLWRKFANSLALRYYMRLSYKEPEFARDGIEKIVDHPDDYPLILRAREDANMSYPGTSSSDSWPSNTVFQQETQGSYMRLKMCATLVDTLEYFHDPRLHVWAKKIDIPLQIDYSDHERDEIVGGIRYVGDSIAADYERKYGYPLDLDPEYVGLPPAWSIVPQAYNLNPNLEQAPYNPHASHLAEIYKKASGPLLVSRMMSAAEVHFIIAEAALQGWTGEDAQTHYEEGVKESLSAWGLAGDYSTYITQAGVAWDGTLGQIMEQKWIASWTAATESWFDWRRTGYPQLKPGKEVKRDAIPLRFYYSVKELDLNRENCEAAISKLEETTFSEGDGQNSAWSKMWLLQGTGEPYK